MSRSFDVAVIGLGAMGSAAADHLARRGRRVLGLDRFAPPHTLGSSHGETRIIREAYFEHPAYVPLVQRAYECWADLERDSGRTLWLKTGGLMLGPPEGTLVTGALASAHRHQLPHEVLDASAVRSRFPAFAPEPSWVGVWEPRAGALFPEACVAAQVERAARAGATLRTGEPALAWSASGDGVEVTTASGRYLADRLLLSAGAWTPDLIEGLDLPLEVLRQPAFWFEPQGRPGALEPGSFPVWICEDHPGRFLYGFPALEGRLKVARHLEGERADPGGVRRETAAAESDAVGAAAERVLPGAIGPLKAGTVCLYTCTPDHHFIVDRHPAHPQVTLVSACSGHGFKFASAMGEVLADLLLDQRPRFDLSLFRLERFTRA